MIFTFSFLLKNLPSDDLIPFFFWAAAAAATAAAETSLDTPDTAFLCRLSWLLWREDRGDGGVCVCPCLNTLHSTSLNYSNRCMQYFRSRGIFLVRNIHIHTHTKILKISWIKFFSFLVSNVLNNFVQQITKKWLCCKTKSNELQVKWSITNRICSYWSFFQYPILSMKSLNEKCYNKMSGARVFFFLQLIINLYVDTPCGKPLAPVLLLFAWKCMKIFRINDC